jgi:hypothetical protein
MILKAQTLSQLYALVGQNFATAHSRVRHRPHAFDPTIWQ